MTELSAEKDEVFRLQVSHSKVYAELDATRALLRQALPIVEYWEATRKSAVGRRIRAALGDEQTPSDTCEKP